MYNDVVHSTVIKTQEASGLLLQKGGAPVHKVKKFLNPSCQNLKLHSQTLDPYSSSKFTFLYGKNGQKRVSKGGKNWHLQILKWN